MSEISDIAAWLRGIEPAKAARAALMPTEQDCFNLLAQARERLQELGRVDAVYSPKDGSQFQAIEFGLGGPGTCSYMGDWPDGGWWMHDGGDMWPSRPIMFKRQSPASPTDDQQAIRDGGSDAIR